MTDFLPDSLLQMSMIFLSIVIEAFPFVLLGCLISGVIQSFLTSERVLKFLPKNKFLAILLGSVLGLFFPSCECGIVPIIHQFLKKGIPEHMAFAFMLTAPIINPIVVFSTYIAFGNNWHFVFLRVGGSLLIAVIVGSWLAYLNRGEILLHSSKLRGCSHHHEEQSSESLSWRSKLQGSLIHSLDELFDSGRYLIMGALLAATMQTYLPTAAILQLGQTKLLAIVVMLLLAFVLSLCSEADAFIGYSLMSLFGTGPITAFLVYGPMVDIKNLLLLKRYFKVEFIAKLIGIITILTVLYAALV